MHVNAVLVIRVRVFEVVSESECGGKFVSGLLVEVRIGTATIDGVVPYTDIGNRLLVVYSGRQISRQVGHEIMDAKIPAQRCHWENIAETTDRFCQATPNRKSRTAKVGHYCRIDTALDSPIGDRDEDVELTPQDRRRKRVAGCREIQWLGAAVNIGIQVSIEIRIDVAEGDLFRERDVPAGLNLRII